MPASTARVGSLVTAIRHRVLTRAGDARQVWCARWCSCTFVVSMKNSGNERRLRDCCNHANAAVTTRGVSQVNLEHASQSLPPCHRGRGLDLGWVARVVGSRIAKVPLFDVTAMFRIEGEHVVITDTVCARTRQQSGQACAKTRRLKQNVGGTVSEGMLERVNHSPIAVDAPRAGARDTCTIECSSTERGEPST